MTRLWSIPTHGPVTITFSSVLLSINIAQEGFPDDSAVKNLPAMQEIQETQVRSLGQKDPLLEGMATHSLEFLPENPMDGGAWWAAVHGVAESDAAGMMSTHTHVAQEQNSF